MGSVPKSLPAVAVLTLCVLVSCREDPLRPPEPPPPAPALDIASISVQPDRAAIEVGDSIQYTATVRDSNGTEISATVEWSSSNSAVGAISPSGLFAASGEGAVIVTATVASTSLSAASNLEVVSEGEIVISEDAVVLDSTKWILLSDSAERATGIYRFRVVGTGGATRNRTDTTRVRVGDYIVGGQGYGFLREVMSVSQAADIVTLETTQAALTDVVLKGDFLHAFPVNDPDGSSRGTLRVQPTTITWAPGVFAATTSSAAIPLDGVDFLKREICFQPTNRPEICFEVGFEVVDGEVRFRPDIDIGGDISGGSLDEFHVRSSGTFNLDAELEFSASLKAGYSLPDSVKVKSGESEKFFHKELFQASTPFSFAIGFLPVFGRIIFNVTLDAEATAGIEATWTSGVHIVYAVSGGLQWDGTGWNRDAPPVPQPSYTEDEFEFDGVKGVGEMQMSVVPELNLELYGVAGPFIQVEPYAKVAGEVDILSGDANAQLLLGTDLNVGFKTNDDVKDLTGIGLEYTALGIPLFRERKALEVFTSNPLFVSVMASAQNGDATSLPGRGYALELGPTDPSKIDTPWWNLFHLDVGCRTVSGAPGPHSFGNAVCAPIPAFLDAQPGAETRFDGLRTGLAHRLEVDKGGARNCAWVGEGLTNPYDRTVTDDTIIVAAGLLKRGERTFELECVAWGQVEVSVTATGDPADYPTGFVFYTGDLTTFDDDGTTHSPADPFTREFFQQELQDGAMFGGSISAGETRNFDAIFSTFAALEVPTNCNVRPDAARSIAYFDSLYIQSEQVGRVHFDVQCDPLREITFTTAMECERPDQPCFTDANGYTLRLRRPAIPDERGWGDHANPTRAAAARFTPQHDVEVPMADGDTTVFSHMYPHDRYDVIFDDVARTCRVESGYLDNDHGNLGRWTGTTRLATQADGSDSRREIAIRCEGYAPEGVRAVALNDNSVQVSWNRTDRPEVGGVAGHLVYRNDILVSPLVPVGHDDPQVDSFIDRGLSADSTYTYRVVMQAVDGRTGASSRPVTAKTDTLPTRPATPASLAAAAQSQTAIQLTWLDRSDNEDQFRLEISLDATNWQLAAHPAANAQSFLHTGLQPGTTYWFRIRAENALATSLYSNSASATTHGPPPPPRAPTNLTATQQAGTNSILLQWTDNADNENEFAIERSLDLGVTWAEIARTGPDVTSFVDDPPGGGSVFTYRVRACNANGCSAYSGTASVTLGDGP